MSVKTDEIRAGERSGRWADALATTARERGDSEVTAQRAIRLCRELNIAPWIALGVAERLITLKDAQLYDRVGRCRELQAAILDRRTPLEELRTTLPYAAHFLAVELLDFRRFQGVEMRTMVRILDGVLSAERKLGNEEATVRVRSRTVEEYATVVEAVLGLMRRTRCDAGMALDVHLGRTTEAFVLDYIRQKRRLEAEERAAAEEAMRPRFPPGHNDGQLRERRPSFGHGVRPGATPPVRRDHWPR